MNCQSDFHFDFTVMKLVYLFYVNGTTGGVHGAHLYQAYTLCFITSILSQTYGNIK